MAGLNLGKGNKGVAPLGKEGNDDKFTANRENVATDNADAQKNPEPGERKWTSSPIQRYKLGRFRFENGLLTLNDAKDIAEFEQLYSELPRAEQSRVKEVSLAMAEAVSREYMKNRARATKGIGSETGDRQPQNQTGTGTLGDSNA